jgi:hypothetical protein
MTERIVPIDRVKRAVDDALAGSCAGSLPDAMAHAAKALCITVEAVQRALQPADFWCCEKGENLGVPVCDDCAEFDAAMRDAWSSES